MRAAHATAHNIPTVILDPGLWLSPSTAPPASTGVSPEQRGQACTPRNYLLQPLKAPFPVAGGFEVLEHGMVLGQLFVNLIPALSLLESCQTKSCRIYTRGLVRRVFNSELDNYVNNLFQMKCILCSCPGWMLIRSRLSS